MNPYQGYPQRGTKLGCSGSKVWGCEVTTSAELVLLGDLYIVLSYSYTAPAILAYTPSWESWA